MLVFAGNLHGDVKICVCFCVCFRLLFVDVSYLACDATRIFVLVSAYCSATCYMIFRYCQYYSAKMKPHARCTLHDICNTRALRGVQKYLLKCGNVILYPLCWDACKVNHNVAISVCVRACAALICHVVFQKNKWHAVASRVQFCVFYLLFCMDAYQQMRSCFTRFNAHDARQRRVMQRVFPLLVHFAIVFAQAKHVALEKPLFNEARQSILLETRHCAGKFRK